MPHTTHKYCEDINSIQPDIRTKLDVRLQHLLHKHRGIVPGNAKVYTATVSILTNL